MFNDKTGEGAEDIDTLIGENTTVKGDVNFKGGLHVDGRIEGSISATGDGVFTLSEKGFVKGQVKVPVMVINGKIEGDLTCDQRLELNGEARITGNVNYANLEMRLGAQVNGQLICSSGEARVSSIAKADSDPKKSGSGAV